MLINEGGLIRAIKRAYKAGGYTVLNTGNDVAIYTDHWFAMANRALLPRKVLATIVEHMGMIPERDMPTSIIKDTEPQLVLRETAADDMDHWRGGDRGEEVTMVPVIMQGFQIYQPPGGGACWGVPLYLVDMIERDPAEHIGADVIAHIMSHFTGLTEEAVEVLSMYDGMSCGHIALDKLGAEITTYYATEIDKYAVQTTQHNFPDTVQLGDAFQVRTEDWHLPEPVEMEEKK